jgi:hypothetical protein
MAQVANPAGATASSTAYGANWGKERGAEFADFRNWVNAAANPNRSLAEGVRLAKLRRAALTRLMKTDPEQAIASAVPEGIRNSLPADVRSQVETRISGIGNLLVQGALRATNGPEVEPIQRHVELNGRSYPAYVYGRRSSETSKRGIPMHGIMVDGVVVLHEMGLRTFEPGETPDPTHPVTDLRTAAEKANALTSPVAAEMGGRTYLFASIEKLLQAEQRIEAAESSLAPVPAQSAEDAVSGNAPAGNATAGAQGNAGFLLLQTKNILILRVDFSDLAGIPEAGQDTQSYVQNLADSQISTYYSQSSYGSISMVNTVGAKLYRMPRLASFYATNVNANSLLITDAETAAASDFTASSYDRIIVVFAYLGNLPGSQITYGGFGDISGPNVRCNGEFDFRVIAHELGHTFGLYHASLWQVSDGNPISATGVNVEYADDFDTMGANLANNQSTDFNPYYKNLLGWIPGGQVANVTASGTYRISRFDNGIGSGTLALKIVKDSSRTYWMGIRRKFTNNVSMHSGAYIIWGYNAVQPGSGGGSLSDLLDMTTPGNSDQDAALAPLASFTDPALGMSIRPLDDGGTAPNEYMDVEIDLGAQTTPVWVDFSFNGSPKQGTFSNPYSTLAQGVYQVSPGGVVDIKGPNSSASTIIISKPLTLQASGGTVIIGQ